MARRFPVIHGAGVPWSTVVCHPDRLDKPLHWRKPRVVLVSMTGDLFHEQVPVGFQLEVLDRIHRCEQQHHFCALTKRPRAAAAFLGARDVVPGNLLLMASVWDQPSTDAACAALSQLPARVCWGLHVEPMLGPIDLVRACIDATPASHTRSLWPAWIVCGGENGPGARPMDPRWALDLRERCKAAGVPFWFKGMGRATDLRTLGPGVLERLEQTREVPW